MSYRYEKCRDFNYKPNKNYDHDIFNSEARIPENRRNNFERARKVSTESSERRIEHKIRVYYLLNQGNITICRWT